jgi:uncharacterized protein
MNNAYCNIAFTPKVRAIQKAMGAPFLTDGRFSIQPATPEKVQLSHEALRFIARRNGFYLATTSETGWPYVQYKGGPRGFLLPLGDSSLAYPDFSGNQQYISTGNFSANAKAAVIFTDYAQRQRLKLFATVEVRPPETEADLLRAFARFNYPSNIERIIVLHVVGFNWNCPSHIYPD